ncbi:hypothetical protein niasHS_010567 [Heterodera schachtii]|uniref:RRM domain-containing protein n=1 Tax=Heterodera schachtii TaxID=97005 RepID=A0ABD2IYP0_HETSC
MENTFREWDVISNDPNGLEVTEEQLRATNRLMSEGQQKQTTEDELMLLGEEDDTVEPERMDAETEEELLGRASVVGICSQKTISVANSNNGKNAKNERTKANSMFGTKYDENLKRFQFNLCGAPSVGPIQFGGGMDLSLISNKSSDASTNNGTTSGGSRSEGKAKTKKAETAATTKRTVVAKRILKRKVPNPSARKLTTDASRHLGGRSATAIRVKKRRSRSLDTMLRCKWDTSSSFLDLISSTDFSSFFDEPKKPRPFDGQKCANSPNTKPNQAKFSFFSSTERMMSEWMKNKNSGTDGRKFEEEKYCQNGDESYDGGGEEGSADEQQVDRGLSWENHWQSDAGGADSDRGEGETDFLGLLNHRETPKAKRHSDKHRTESEPSPKSYEAASAYITEFSPKTTLFVCPVPPTLDENGLKGYFLTFGEVRSVVVPHNPFTGEHRGFGFVDFANETSAKAAYAKRGLIWPRGGLKPFNLNWYRPKRPFSPPSSNSELYVFGLSQKCTEFAIFSYFGRYGSIERAQIGRTTDGGRAALLRFTDWRSASRAIEENPKQCEWAKTVAEAQEQDGTPPMKKWVNVFDLPKSTNGNSPSFRPSRRSENSSPTIHKQFFPDLVQQKRKGRSQSMCRFLATEDDDAYNGTADKDQFEEGKRDNEWQQKGHQSQSEALNRAKVSIGAKRPLTGASSSSEDDSDVLVTREHVPRKGRTLFRAVDAKRCDSVGSAVSAQQHRSRSHKPKPGWNSVSGEGSGAAILATPSPSLPSSSSSSLALESSLVSAEEFRRTSTNSSSSVSALHEKYALFNEFIAFLEWREKSNKSA